MADRILVFRGGESLRPSKEPILAGRLCCSRRPMAAVSRTRLKALHDKRPTQRLARPVTRVGSLPDCRRFGSSPCWGPAANLWRNRVARTALPGWRKSRAGPALRYPGLHRCAWPGPIIIARQIDLSVGAMVATSVFVAAECLSRHPILAFAGLWDRWIEPATKEETLSCTVIVSGASAWMTPYHDRMPVCCGRKILRLGSTALSPRMRCARPLKARCASGPCHGA
jgi:SOS response associated peptidase (SRAP)